MPEDLKKTQESQRGPSTKIATDENSSPDVLKTPSWWVRCPSYGEPWEGAYKVWADDPKKAVDHWARETDGEVYHLTEGKHAAAVEVVSHEDYLVLTAQAKPKQLITLHRYEVRGRLEPIYYIKER